MILLNLINIMITVYDNVPRGCDLEPILGLILLSPSPTNRL